MKGLPKGFEEDTSSLSLSSAFSGEVGVRSCGEAGLLKVGPLGLRFTFLGSGSKVIKSLLRLNSVKVKLVIFLEAERFGLGRMIFSTIPFLSLVKCVTVTGVVQRSFDFPCSLFPLQDLNPESSAEKGKSSTFSVVSATNVAEELLGPPRASVSLSPPFIGERQR